MTGRSDVWVSEADGTQRRRLPLRTVWGQTLSWSPDGRWLASERNGVATVRVSDGTVRQLTRGHDVTPAWSPDGDRIAFLHEGDAPCPVYTVRPTGGAAEPLSSRDDLRGYVGSLTWTPH